MLKKFEVRNYKGFKDSIVLNLSATRPYSNYRYLIKNKIVKNAIVYGDNASGKSNLCSALMDITYNLLDVSKDVTPPYLYSYIGNDDTTLDFKYIFQFEKNEVIYQYKINNTHALLLEKLYVNGVEIIRYDFLNTENNFIKIKDLNYLKPCGLSNQLSVLKYIYDNTDKKENDIVSNIYEFVKGMLCFRSLRDGNEYIGYRLGGDKLDSIILKKDKLKDFQHFLHYLGLNYNLFNLQGSNSENVIGIKFDNGKIVALRDISSSGMRTLMLFYCWLLEFDKLTFLIIDEFDAYYHHKVSKKILDIINSYNNFQSVVTTHNVTLLNTNVTRPDCAYIIDDNGVINLCNRIDKDIRKNHNIEKMYREGDFYGNN